MFPTVMLGVPVNPAALVAEVADVALPDNAPEKVVAVTIPPKAVIALPTFRVAAVATPLIFRLFVSRVPSVPTPDEK